MEKNKYFDEDYFNEVGDGIALSKLGVAAVERFKKEHLKFYSILALYVTSGVTSLLEEELDPETWKKVRKIMCGD